MSADYRRPSYLELRQRIEEYPQDEYRLGFMYQDLICGRESEVCGKGTAGVYAAQGKDAFHVKYRGEVDTVLFTNRSAKRGGFYRPCMVPLTTDYEPWSRELLDYAEDHPDYMFKYGPAWSTSMRYYREHASECLKGLYWPRVEYTKSMEKRIRRDQIIRESVNQNNKTVYLVELDGETKWYTVKDDHTILVPTKVPSKWKPVSAHTIRKAKERRLEMHYDFNGSQISTYGGWTYKGKDQGVSDALRHYQFDPIMNPRDNLDILIKAAETYIDKLMVPYQERRENQSYVVGI